MQNPFQSQTFQDYYCYWAASMSISLSKPEYTGRGSILIWMPAISLAFIFFLQKAVIQYILPRTYRGEISNTVHSATTGV